MSYLFVFRAAPDIDHMAPVAWRLLEDGEAVHAVVSSDYDADGDYRLGFLRGYPRFRLHRRRYLGRTLPAALALLAAHRVRFVAVEWGYGLPAGYQRLPSPGGAVAVLRSLARSFLKARSDPAQLRNSFVVAARLLRIPTACLPHGLSVKHDQASNAELKRLEDQGPIDWTDRNRFSAFVFNTEELRRWYVEHAMGDPEVMQTWGSVRWSPAWFERNRALAPSFEWPEPTDRLKVVFMAPKWRNRVHKEAAVELVRRLQELDFISLGVMGHPRLSGADDPLREDPSIDWSRIHDLTGANSVALIEAADVVLDVGSSIGLEVVMQGKVLVNPTYIHELTTLFDSVEGSAVVANSPDEVVGYMHRHAAGDPHTVDQDAYDELMRQAVYGSRTAPFDVLEEYAGRVKALAGRNGATIRPLQKESTGT